MSDQYHLTLTDNKPNNYAILQGATYSFTLSIPGDFSRWIPLAQIRKNIADIDPLVLASFNFAPLTWDNLTNLTTITPYLTATQTQSLPVTPLRASVNETLKPGINVWLYDLELENPDVSSNKIKIIRSSNVEVLGEISRS